MENNPNPSLSHWHQPEEEEEESTFLEKCNSFVSAVVSLIAWDQKDDSSSHPGRTVGSANIKRDRVPVETIFANLGARLVRKCYRMPEPLFWRLHGLLEPHLPQKNKRKRGSTPNGDIPNSARLSMALRWFAGGDPADIFQVHGVHLNEVYTSVWAVVDAINLCPELQMKFPSNHEEQREIAQAFKEKSKADLDGCVGCVDGMLVWTNKPSKLSLDQVGVGPKKFFCGRKKKFGLNLQAICDHKKRFMDVEIEHPAATSDYLCFTTSDIHQKLKEVGFLADGLCLFGDNAYVNTPFMATPYRGVTDGPKDAYNFYHSSLRITVECAFGMLVHRWGVLRRAIPVNISVVKTTQLVRALCILHNFCIDNKDDTANEVFADDHFTGISSGGFAHSAPNERPHQLMDGGEHFDDVPRAERRVHERRGDELPRERYVAHLEAMGITKRPAPRGTTSTSQNT